MTKICDHTSVGMLVWRDDKLLLIERRKPPFGFAPPAGHVDDHGSYEEAAKRELEEEVGLITESVKLVAEGRKEFTCRRKGGDWHYWKIFQVAAEGNLKRSEEETKRAHFYDKEFLVALAEKTERYLDGKITNEDWENSPGFDPVWYEWLQQLKII